MGKEEHTPAVIGNGEAATKCINSYGTRNCTLGYSECDEFTLWCEIEDIECGYQHGNACDMIEVAEVESKPNGHGLTSIMRFRGLR